jgi:hypothetical protein
VSRAAPCQCHSLHWHPDCLEDRAGGARAHRRSRTCTADFRPGRPRYGRPDPTEPPRRSAGVLGRGVSGGSGLHRQGRAAIAAVSSGQRWPTVPKIISKLMMPSIFIARQRDGFAPPAWSRYLAQLASAARIVLPGAPASHTDEAPMPHYTNSLSPLRAPSRKQALAAATRAGCAARLVRLSMGGRVGG